MTTNGVVLERIRGHVLVEGKEKEQDYELIVNFNEITLKPLKNKENRLSPDQLGVIFYGRGLNEETLRQMLKSVRTPVREELPLRTVESVTADELAELEVKF
jgi:hypothetical protein